MAYVTHVYIFSLGHRCVRKGSLHRRTLLIICPKPKRTKSQRMIFATKCLAKSTDNSIQTQIANDKLQQTHKEHSHVQITNEMYAIDVVHNNHYAHIFFSCNFSKLFFSRFEFSVSSLILYAIQFTDLKLWRIAANNGGKDDDDDDDDKQAMIMSEECICNGRSFYHKMQ